MAEYIEREALITRLNKVCVTDDVFGMGMQTGIEHAINCTKEAPTADVVKVVRCKDCEHLKRNSLYAWCEPNSTIWDKYIVQPDNFCCWGKRRGD